MKETYKACQDCTHWQPNDKIKNGVGACLINIRPDILKWPCLTACQEFLATRKDPVQDRIIRRSHG